MRGDCPLQMNDWGGGGGGGGSLEGKVIHPHDTGRVL